MNSWLTSVLRTSPPSLLSPLQASASPPSRTPNGFSSPVLAALGSIPSIDQSSAPPQTTTDWAKDVPFGSSPPGGHSNGISIAGSPQNPLQPHAELRGGFSHASPPTSPSAAYRQPTPRNNGYQSFGYLGTSPGRARSASMRSHNSHQPPLPHQPQAHYHGAPEINFGSRAGLEDKKTVNISYCLFDSLASAGEEGSRTTENVLLVGYESGLDVYAVDKTHFSRVGRLEGLRGSVIGAKVLPSTTRDDPMRPWRPLVAAVVHGPYIPSELDLRPPSGPNHGEDELFDPSNSMLQALESADTAGPNVVTHFQTTVEIFSLRMGEHIATLFRGAKKPLELSPNDYQPTKPSPDENLQIEARGRFVTVNSGTSGEVFIFESKTSGAEASSYIFQCIGKVWTKVSHRKTRSLSISSNSSEPGILQDQSPTRCNQTNAATVSLSHRWLAVLPPTPSSQSTLHGSVGALRPASKSPGLTSHTPPAEPLVNCELETPDQESVLKKLGRVSTQEALKGARWVSDQGLQAWKNYWKPPEQNPQAHPSSFPSTMAPPMHQAFPPTHAHEDLSVRANNQPALVSIIDLEKLSVNQQLKPSVALQPIATFSLPDGCSLVSFTPSGLGLLTASAKGDVQHIWDLMRMVHGGSSINSLRDHNASGRESDIGPTVRQIWRHSRLTEARIVDVAWTEPKGERLALVTERNTLHIHELPPSAFQWPPSRRVLRPTTASNNPGVADQDFDHTVQPRSSSNTFSGALNMVADKTQPLFANLRGRQANNPNPFAGLGGLGFTAGAGMKGIKVVAAGFNKSVGAATGTVRTIRHRGENRLALPGSPQKIVAGCIKWLGGKHHGHIAVTGGGLVRIYPVQQNTTAKGGQRGPSVVGKRPIEYSIPNISGDSINHVLKDTSAFNKDVNQTLTSAHGYWLSPASGHGPKAFKNQPPPLSCAEIETNAPYQPFHTDRRINFYVYNDETSSDMHHLSDASPWVFGENIPATKVNVSSAVHDTDSDTDPGAPAPMENLISFQGNDEEGQQVVVTTRRKRGKKGPAAEGDDGEFFEDDCEVVDFAESRV